MKNTGNQSTTDILDLYTGNPLQSVSMEYQELTNSLYSRDIGCRYSPYIPHLYPGDRLIPGVPCWNTPSIQWPPYLTWSCYGIFIEKLQDFSESHNFPIK